MKDIFVDDKLYTDGYAIDDAHEVILNYIHKNDEEKCFKLEVTGHVEIGKAKAYFGECQPWYVAFRIVTGIKAYLNVRVPINLDLLFNVKKEGIAYCQWHWHYWDLICQYNLGKAIPKGTTIYYEK